VVDSKEAEAQFGITSKWNAVEISNLEPHLFVPPNPGYDHRHVTFLNVSANCERHEQVHPAFLPRAIDLDHNLSLTRSVFNIHLCTYKYQQKTYIHPTNMASAPAALSPGSAIPPRVNSRVPLQIIESSIPNAVVVLPPWVMSMQMTWSSVLLNHYRKYFAIRLDRSILTWF